MLNGGMGRREIVVTHKNVSRLYFRAYAQDLVATVENSRGSSLQAHEGISSLLETSEPDIEWSVDLPATPDYRSQQTHVRPPVEKPGLYVPVTSCLRARVAMWLSTQTTSSRTAIHGARFGARNEDIWGTS